MICYQSLVVAFKEATEIVENKEMTLKNVLKWYMPLVAKLNSTTNTILLTDLAIYRRRQ